MKLLISLIIFFFSSVAFLYYLLSNQNFLPKTMLGEYDWLNIFIFILVLFAVLFSLCMLLSILILTLFKKETTLKQRLILSFKVSSFVMVGFVVVLTLNFFHILDLLWGMAVLIVVLIAIFII